MIIAGSTSAYTDLSRQSHPSQQLDIKVYLSFLLLYPAQAFLKARIYQIYQQT
jgi:hypothetical protein